MNVQNTCGIYSCALKNSIYCLKIEWDIIAESIVVKGFNFKLYVRRGETCWKSQSIIFSTVKWAKIVWERNKYKFLDGTIFGISQHSKHYFSKYIL